MNLTKLRHYRKMANLHSVLLVVLLAGLLAALGYLVGGSTLAWAAAMGVGALYLVTPRMAPWLLLRSFRARPMDRWAAPELTQALEQLTTRAGLRHRPRLFLLPHAQPAAFTAGEGTGAVIAVSQGLLRTLNLREVTGVLAHEVSHIRHQDTHIMGFAQTLSQMTSLLATTGQLLLLISLPLVLIQGGGVSLAALVLLILAPQASLMIHLALSRAREYSADMSAAELLGSPAPLAEALHRLDGAIRGRRGRPAWGLVPRRQPPHWLSTHPPTEARIRRLLQTASPPPWSPALYRWRSGY